jgi:ubiquinone/menaquinone biosynthesis C-methylase UbiE
MAKLFEKSAEYYDAIYDAVGKNYKREANRLRRLIQEHKRSAGNTLLDVACGTGRHLMFLKRHFNVEGLDLDPILLEIARKRNRGVPFYIGDMQTFKLQRQFDVITCLFSAIGYMKTVSGLQRAVRNMERHLKTGGVLIVEPWLTPTKYSPRHLSAVFVNMPELKIVRMNNALRKSNRSILDFHYMVGTPEKISYFRETEDFGLFTRKQYMSAFRSAGLKVHYDPRGLIGRGLYVGRKPLRR